MSKKKMHDNELSVTAEVVSRLISDQFPRWKDLPLHQVPSAGTDNALFNLGDEMVVRLPRIDWAVSAIEKEQRWLPFIATFLSAKVPSPVALGAPNFEYPHKWSIYNWLPGENPILGHIQDPNRFSLDLANFIRDLQRIEIKGAPISNRGVPLVERDADTRSALAALVSHKESFDLSEVLEAWEFALQLGPGAELPVWIHGDLTPGNILVNDGKLSAIIDFGSLGIGDPFADLIVAWNLLPSSSRELFRSHMRVSDSTWKRGRGLALSVALIQLPYYAESNPEVAENARYVINEVLVDYRGNDWK